MTAEDEINKIGEEIDLYETEANLVNNIVPKPKEFGEPSYRNTHFLRPRYILPRRTINFSFGFVLRKTTTFEEIDLSSISQTEYIVIIDGAHNRERNI